MSRIKIALVILTFGLSSQFLLSQNYVMASDESGLHGTVSLSTGTFEDGLSIMPGYTWNGRFTAGLDLGKGKDKINKINSTLLMPHLSFLVLKQKEEGLPLSVNIKAGYQLNFLPTTSFNSRSVQFSGQIFHELKVQNGVKVIPQIGLLTNKPLVKNGFSDNKELDFIYNAAVTILWQSIYFEPGFFIGDGNRGFSLMIGYLL